MSLQTSVEVELNIHVFWGFLIARRNKNQSQSMPICLPWANLAFSDSDI